MHFKLKLIRAIRSVFFEHPLVTHAKGERGSTEYHHCRADEARLPEGVGRRKEAEDHGRAEGVLVRRHERQIWAAARPGDAQV